MKKQLYLIYFMASALSGVLLTLTCRTTDAQTVLTLKFNQVMDSVIGVGGNYCFNTEHPNTRYTLDNLKPTIARTEMTLKEWEPENDNDDPHSTNWEYFKSRDPEGSNLRLEFEIMQELSRKNIPFITAIWTNPEWISAPKEEVPPEKWDEQVESMCSYLLYAKQHYNAEPSWVSFNEFNNPTNVKWTADNHIKFIGVLGERMEQLGLKTKCFLGDVGSGVRGWAYLMENLTGDEEQLKYATAFGFHSWGGNAYARTHYPLWRQKSDEIGLPLIIGEAGVDARAHVDKQFASFEYGIQEMIHYMLLFLYGRPQGIIRWEFTGDYDLLRGGNPETARFAYHKHWINFAQPGSRYLGTEGSTEDLLFAAFRDAGNGRFAMHVANAADAASVEIKGIPRSVKSLHVICTEKEKLYEERPDISVSGGKVSLQVPARSLTTLWAEFDFGNHSGSAQDQKLKYHKPDGRSIHEILADKYSTGSFFVGATLGYHSLDDLEREIFLNDFKYSTPENAAKQSTVHPEPCVWNWGRIDRFADFAAEHDILLRLHSPVSPQCSRWAKEDNRTPEELEMFMTEYMTGICKHFNGNKQVKWMDVVNETILRDGSFQPDRPGTQGESPWYKIGLNDDPNRTPLYIIKAFELAQEHAPDIKLLYNQNLDTRPEVWDKVKSTILYLRSLGLRVDAMGWQAHLRHSGDFLIIDDRMLEQLAELIDWAHAHDLEFHITENDYNFVKGYIPTDEELMQQARAYADIMKVLIGKRHGGVIAYNTWGLSDRYPHNLGDYMMLFDENMQPKYAYYALQEVLEHHTDNPVQSPGIEQGGRYWNASGQAGASSTGQRSGLQCLKITAGNSSVSQVVEGLEPDTQYELSAWVKSSGDEPITLTAEDYGGKAVHQHYAGSTYQQVSVVFHTGDQNSTARIIFHKQDSGSSPGWADDFTLYQLH